MTPSVLENVADAIEAEAKRMHAGETRRQMELRIARAALASIAEPTKEMRLAVNRAQPGADGFGWFSQAVELWERGHRAMISTALKEDSHE